MEEYVHHHPPYLQFLDEDFLLFTAKCLLDNWNPLNTQIHMHVTAGVFVVQT